MIYIKNRGGPLQRNKMFIRMCYRRPDGNCLGPFCIYNNFFTIEETHITQMLKDKTEGLESRGKNPILMDPGALRS
jgi:hypothetical protein